MEDMIMRKQSFMPTNPSPLSINPGSRQIAKVKPKIRIIHIFAPEIIKTDVSNFRELVQRLTGKPSNNTDHHHKSSGKRKPGKLHQKSSAGTAGTTMMSLNNRPLMIARKMEPSMNGLIGNSNISHHEDYFSGFSDIDRFIQDMSELPLLPMDPSSHYHHNHQIPSSFGESRLT